MELGSRVNNGINGSDMSRIWPNVLDGSFACSDLGYLA